MKEPSDLLAGLPDALLSPAQEQSLAWKDGEAARATLVLHAIRGAFSYVRRVSRGRLPDDELLSLCYLALSKAVENFKPGQQGFFPYAKAYLRGEIARAWRSRDVVRNAYKHQEPKLDDQAPKELEDSFVNPAFNEIHWAELWEELQPVLKRKLTPREQQILERRYLDGKNFREIGTEFRVTREAVRISHGRALRKVRRYLLEKKRLFNDE